MVLLIDSNIILDVLQKREPHFKLSHIIYRMCEQKFVDGYISTLTFTNIIYIMRKVIVKRKVNDFYKSMKKIFTFIDFTEKDIEKAADMEWADFEDAIQYVSAEKANADFIITRNVKDFELTEIQAIMPEEFIIKFENENKSETENEK